MKKAIFAVLLVVIVLLASCSVANTPTAVTRAYFDALAKNDMKALAKVTTSETLKNLAQMGDKAHQVVVAYGKLLSISEEIDGDTAIVTVVFENEEGEIDLRKINGKWKVSEWDGGLW